MVRVKKLFISLLLLSITMFANTACSGCPEDDEEKEKFEVFTLPILGMDNHQWAERVSIDLGYQYRAELNDYFRDFSNDLEVGHKELLFGNKIVPFGIRNAIEIPSQFNNCTQTNVEKEYVCVISESDTLYNSFSGANLLVANAKNSIVTIQRDNDAFEISDTLAKSNSSFIAENRYKISSFHNLDVSNIGSIFFQQSDLTREIVTDSSGVVINDVLFYRETFQNLLKNGEVTSIVEYGSLAANEDVPRFTVSENEQFLLYELRNEIFLKASDQNWKKVAVGSNPKLFSNGEKIFYRTSAGYKIKDLMTNESLNIPVESYRVRHADTFLQSNVVYFIETWTLKSFHPDENTIQPLRNIEELIQRLREDGGENYYHSLQPQKLFIYDENSPKIMMISSSRYNYYSSC